MFSLAIVNYLHSQMEKIIRFCKISLFSHSALEHLNQQKTSLSTDLVILYIIVFYYRKTYGKLDWLCCGKKKFAGRT